MLVKQLLKQVKHKKLLYSSHYKVHLNALIKKQTNNSALYYLEHLTYGFILVVLTDV